MKSINNVNSINDLIYFFARDLLQSNLFSFRVKKISFCRFRVIMCLSMDGLRFLYKVWVIKGRVCYSLRKSSCQIAQLCWWCNFRGLDATQKISDSILSESGPTLGHFNFSSYITTPLSFSKTKFPANLEILTEQQLWCDISCALQVH